ncbi:MAG: YidC/Oxa1 family membrane protein insertase [Actinomycetota bacterium]
MFDALFDGIAGLLNFFYELVPSYGLAIALVTLAVMLLCFPLTAKATRSMAAMSKLQPEIRRIQQKYKNDRQKQSEETMALFKERNVTPFGGCLPMLVQAPVFFIMYRILFGLTSRGPDGTFAPKYLSPDSELFQVLDGARTMRDFGMDLAKTATEALKDSFLTGLPYFVLIAGVVATGYYQQRQITRRNPPSDPASDNPYMQSMQRMTKIYPLMYLIFGVTLPAGLNVYFLVSNAFRIGQQALIYKLDPTLLPAGKEEAATRVDTKPPRPAKEEGGSKGEEKGAEKAGKDRSAHPAGGKQRGSRPSSGGANGKAKGVPSKSGARRPVKKSRRGR